MTPIRCRGFTFLNNIYKYSKSYDLYNYRLIFLTLTYSLIHSVISASDYEIITNLYFTGIPSLLPFLKAVCRSKKSWQARHTGIKIVQQIAILMGCAILPHLKSLVEIIEHGKCMILFIFTIYFINFGAYYY